MQVDHLGIAVHSIPEALARFEPTVGARATPPERIESQKVRVSFLPAGETEIEFLEPLEEDSPVGRFLASRGEGFHHVAFRVDSVDSELQKIRDRGLRVVDQVGRPGARGRRVGFAHPSAFHGVLVEFVEGA